MCLTEKFSDERYQHRPGEKKFSLPCPDYIYLLCSQPSISSLGKVSCSLFDSSSFMVTVISSCIFSWTCKVYKAVVLAPPLLRLFSSGRSEVSHWWALWYNIATFFEFSRACRRSKICSCCAVLYPAYTRKPLSFQISPVANTTPRAYLELYIDISGLIFCQNKCLS